MDADLAVLLRFLERMLAVAIGGLAIYLGYRLFSLVPVSKDSEGRVNLSKDFSIVLSRVGPGVFFALFGAFVTGISLYKSVVVNVQPEQTTNAPAVSFQGAGGVGTTTDDAARADTRMLLKREIAILNTLPKLLDSALPPHERANVELAIPRIKLALMKPVWGEAAAGWGTPEAFEQWQKENDGGPPPAEIAEAVKYFNCPERGGP
jgi:hypothetical protein